MSKTLWWSQCRCGVRKETIAEANLTRTEINDIFMEKFNMSLFPCRCEKCRNDELQVFVDGNSQQQ